jgi:hypothetical protein
VAHDRRQPAYPLTDIYHRLIDCVSQSRSHGRKLEFLLFPSSLNYQHQQARAGLSLENSLRFIQYTFLVEPKLSAAFVLGVDQRGRCGTCLVEYIYRHLDRYQVDTPELCSNKPWPRLRGPRGPCKHRQGLPKTLAPRRPSLETAGFVGWKLQTCGN